MTYQRWKTVLGRGLQVSFVPIALVLGRGSLAAGGEFHDGTGHRWAELPVPSTGKVGFTRLSSEATGITFTNSLSEARSLTNHILLNGSGVAAGDVDGDGRCDLYVCGLDGPNALYRNLGQWRFQDVAAEAGVACPGLDATGAVLADIDGDGDLDLLVTSIGRGVRLFLNDGRARFQETTAAAGLASKTGSMSMALADVDGDADLDLYVANYRTSTVRDTFRMQIRVNQVEGKRVITMVNGRRVADDPELEGRFSIGDNGGLVENGQADVLYLNDGQGHFIARGFVDGTFLDEDGRPLKTPLYDWSLSAAFRDLNGDGAPDLYVCSDMASPDRIWINDGSGRFHAIRRLALRKTSWFSMGLDFADLNRDGYDEIFVTDMVSRSHRSRQVQISDHQPVFSPVGVFDNRPQAPRNTLFVNCGDGDFLEVAYFSGLDATEWSWSPVFLDVDLDGFEDVLVVTGFERDVQDIDVANQLEVARRNQRLSDADALRMRKMFPRLALPNLAFRNRGDLTFEETGAGWGFATSGISQGTALADLDNDGDLDVVVNNMNGPLGVYRNDSIAPRLALRLQGLPPNRRGVGAKIRLYGGAVLLQSQEMMSGGRYLSCDEATRTFAAGSLTNTLTIEITWRSGRRSVVTNAVGNRLYELAEAAAAPGGEGFSMNRVPSPQPSRIGWERVTDTSAAAPQAKAQGQGRGGPPGSQPSGMTVGPRELPLFTDVSHLLDHTHVDQEFNDFARQPLLPRKLSQLGPGVAWHDLDGDGWDDLIVGTGRGGRLAVFRNDGQGGFQSRGGSPVTPIATRDQSSVLGWTLPDGRSLILAGSCNYEDGLPAGGCVQAGDLSAKVVEDVLPAHASSVGPLALVDLEGDGDPDLFVGGRVRPGRYPEPADSKLFRNEGGGWIEDAATGELLSRVGLVSGAVFSDLDADGFPELVLACEWGPLRIFRNASGRFSEWNPPIMLEAQTRTLSQVTGWWNGVTAADLDGDGRLDLIASNWGSNTKYQAYRQQPLRLYYGDFNGSGSLDLLEAYYEPAMTKIVPWQHLGRIGIALPFVRARFGSFRVFAEASVAEILGDRAGAARELSANWLETTAFLNRGDHFEARALPLLAQLAPAFAVCAGDLDGDGHTDLFLSQNFFATEPETGRYDGGRGLWLRGDGTGGFNAVMANQSGIRVYGEQRGAALCDYDADGRLDVVVTQNGAATKLFHNVGARPGLRVRLRGPAGNPHGVGAVVRLKFGTRLGPALEVHAGAGYWSQDSAVLIFGTPESPTEALVRWPGSRTSSMPVPSGAREVVLTFSGLRADAATPGSQNRTP